MVLRRFLIAIALLVATALQAHAAGKVALVIGNGAYQNANPLPNPTNDANDMIAKLKELGFEVFGGTDLTFVDMGSKIGEFEDAARDADVTLLFYAGHGMQVNGRNYLVPVDAKLERESSLRFQTIDSEDVLRAMAGPGKTAIQSRLTGRPCGRHVFHARKTILHPLIQFLGRLFVCVNLRF